MWLSVVFILAISCGSTPSAGNKLDFSFRGLTKEQFFRDGAGSVEGQVEAATELNLRGNLFDNFLDCSAKLDKLEVLDLSQNRLKNFYFECKETDNLYKLNVSHNQLTSLNDTALSERVSKLQVLDLSHNKIHHLNDRSFQHLENLRFLALTANPIYNNVHAGAFRNFKSLMDLHLDDVFASNFPAGLFAPLVKLRRLSLASNPLTSLPALPAGITTLDISLTNIFLIENVDLPSLKVLTMNSMPGLRSFDLNTLEKLKNLTTLSIEDSPRFKKLTATPAGTDLLPALREISLRNCNLNDLGPEVQSVMQKATILDLQDNPWHCDCGIKWILPLKSTMNYHDRMRCRSPEELRDKRISEIPTSEFHCAEVNFLALWLVLGILAVLIFPTVSYCFREPILRRWRAKSTRGDTVSYKIITAVSNDTERILDQTDIVTDYP